MANEVKGPSSTGSVSPPNGFKGDMEILDTESPAEDTSENESPSDDSTEEGDPLDLIDSKEVSDDSDFDLEDREEESEEESEDDKKVVKEKEEPETEEDKELKDSVEYQTLKKAGIFKKFPGLKEVFFREQKFTQIYPTIKDAQAASERSRVLGKLEVDLAGGNIEPILKAVVDPKVLEKIAYNFMPEIQKLNKDLHLNILKPVFKNLARGMYTLGEKNKNNDIKNAALHLHNFIFDNTDLKTDVEVPGSKDTKEDPVAKKEAEFIQKQFNSAQGDVSSRVNNRLVKAVSDSLSGIEGVNDFLRGKMVESILNKVYTTLAKDTRSKAQMDALWETAKSGGFDEGSKASIASTFLARAKPLVRAAREEVLRDAIGKVVNINRTKLPSRPSVGGERRSSETSSRSNINAKDVDWRKTSDRDFLDGKIASKRK